MSWKFIEPILIAQPVDEVSSTKKHPLGYIAKAMHDTYGGGEFIYLKGVANTVAGSWVTYNLEDGTTALLAANAIGPVAVSMAALVADTYGWYQINGLANAVSADVADSGKVYIDTASGKCDDAVVVGDRVTNAKWASNDDTATGKALARISRPFVTDQKDAT